MDAVPESSSQDDHELLAAAFEAAGIGVCFLDERGFLLNANPAFCHLVGHRKEDILGRSWLIMVPPERVTRADQFLAALFSDSPRIQEEWQILRKDGSLMTALTSFRPIISKDGARRVVVTLTNIDRRKEVEQLALRRSEEHHRILVNNLTEAVMVAQDGAIAFANPRLLEWTGYDQEEPPIGLPLTVILHPDDRAMVIDRHIRRLRGEEVIQHYPIRLLNRRTGDIKITELSAVVIEWEERPATLCFISDITHRKELENKLTQSLAERDTILDNSILGMAFLNAEGRINWVNRAMYRIFGADLGIDPIGKSLEPYYPSREIYLKTGGEVLEAVRQGLPYETELQMKRTDGSLFWAYLSGRAVNPTDLSQGTVWVIMDITKRRQLEADQAHYQQVVNNVTESIIVVQDGRIIFANPRVMQLTGMTEEQVHTQPFVTAIHPEDRPMVIDRHMRRLRGEQVEQYYQFRVINQETCELTWVELSAVMIDWEGTPATLSFLTDVTERRRLEESLRQSTLERARLEKLQFENELKEAEMARRHAEETTRAKSMFLANMSHEIRTPMNAIIGMAHLALRTELDAKQRDYVEKIQQSGQHLLGIINDILDFSKIEAGKLDMEKVDFNLDEVLKNIATVTAGRAHEKGLEYLFQVPPAVPRHLVGDPLRLGQVLINLINNAIKFTESGEIHIACRQLEVSADNRIKLEFAVRDTGIGMTPEQSSKLFRAFSQADESTTRKYGGTGLGLSISKGMVELMGGRIWLNSEAKRGTTIYFTAWFDQASQAAKRYVVPEKLNGMRVLVVDDNAAARAVIAENLSVLPVAVTQAAGGEEALAAIRDSDADLPFGIAFIDLTMPQMDGIALISAIRNDRSLRAPPLLVLISTQGNDEVRRRAESALADAFLSKPLSPSMLVDAMTELFAGESGTAPAKRGGRAMMRFTGLTLLLVEDNEINQQIALELLEAAGITVHVAENGRIALETLQAVGPDHYGMVFMDVQMPEMDGHEATRRIRADARFAKLPIVAMTAHAMVEERERCFASGMNDHLTKPIDPTALYDAVARWCPNHVVDKTAANGNEPAVAYQEDDLVIEGVNVKDGLSRTLGNRAFYLQLLERFRDGQQNTVADIRSALEQEEQRGVAERLAHTLKGVAGQLGIAAVQSMADQVVARIRRGEDRQALMPLLERLDADMQAVQRQLSHILPAQPAASASAVAVEDVDRDAVLKTMRHIAGLLRQYDGEAIDLLMESGALLATALGANAQQRIARAARQFDFDATLLALTDGARTAGFEI
jgi:two-component system sensor histidine kinase/response regulator